MMQRIRGEERRAQLMDAALALFAEHGYEGTSTRAIATAAGVTEGLIFKHFPTKRDLLRAVIERHAPCPEEAFERRIEQEPIDRALELLLDHMVDVLWSKRQFVRIVIMESFRQGEAFQELQALMEQRPKLMWRLLEERAAAREILLPDPAAAAEMLGGAVVSFFLRHQHRGEEEWRRRSHRFIREVIHLFLEGARTSGASRAPALGIQEQQR